MAAKALGIFEVKGKAALIAAADAMLKAADVELGGHHGVGSGWVTVEILGDVAAVETAMVAGRAAADQRGELICTEVVARPDEKALGRMPHRAVAGGMTTKRALGLLETQNLVPLIVGADAMAKAADVELCGWTFIGGALVHLVVRGDVAAVQTAVAVGGQAAAEVGTVHDSLVLPQPSLGLGILLPPKPTEEAVEVGALGVLETIGYAGTVAGVDSMTKAAEIEVLRLSIGSGGRLSALIAGGLDDVSAALAAGKATAATISEVQGAQVVSRPDAGVMACFGGAAPIGREGTGRALGLIETRSTIALVKALDQMMKSANIEYEGRYKVGYYLTAAAIRGDVGSVQLALEQGAVEAARYGELVATHLIPYPYGELEARLVH